MIYTEGLHAGTNHIMIYDGNTPISIIKVSFYYNPTDCYGGCDLDGWISYVDMLLSAYSTKRGIEYSQLSAKPINVEYDTDYTIGEK